MIRRSTVSSGGLRQRHSQQEWMARWKILIVALPSFFLGTTMSLLWEFSTVVADSSRCVCQSPTLLGSSNNLVGEAARRLNQDFGLGRRPLKDSNGDDVSKTAAHNNDKSNANTTTSKQSDTVHDAIALDEKRINSRDEGGESINEDDNEDEEDDDSIYVPPNAIFPRGLASMIAGAAVISKSNFTDMIDLGVPLDEEGSIEEDVLILYSRPESMPDALQDHAHQQTSTPLPRVQQSEALKNCEIVQVALVDHGASRDQCLALVPQFESYHILKYMRVLEKSKRKNKKSAQSNQKEGIDGDSAEDFIKSLPLKLASRGLNQDGVPVFIPPQDKRRREAWNLLRDYMDSHDKVLEEVQAVIDQQVTPYQRAIVVMVCNWGQSKLLLNFVCHAQSRGLDLSSVLIFATDELTRTLAEGLGLAVYYDQHNFEDMPSEAANSYGDSTFKSMMMAKLFCIHVVSSLGYDFLFQDVDILWYRHPLRDYFLKERHWSANYDMVFQDDGAHTLRYTPYSANSGFYFVRHNPLTRHFVDTLLTTGSFMTYQWTSQQQALIVILSEFVSLYGLKAKVVSREYHDMPGGYHWNINHDYMKSMFRNDFEPLIFHMSWTKNKDIKIQFFQQMNAWHVHDLCMDTSNATVPVTNTSNTSTTMQKCCSVKPLFQCHYGDKPSFHPCRDSPFLSDHGESFW